MPRLVLPAYVVDFLAWAPGELATDEWVLVTAPTG